MDEEMKKRIAKAKAAGFTDEQINATVQAVESQKAQSGMTVDNAVTPEAPKKEGFLKSTARALVKPALDYGKLLAGTGVEVARAVDSKVLGNKDAYDVQKGWKNPFITREEFQKDYSNPVDITKQVAKKSAGAAAYVVPGGASAKAVLAGGAAAGGLYGFSQSEANDLEGMAVDTAVGAGTGLVTAGALNVGGKVLKNLTGAGNAMRKGVVNPKVSADPFMAEEEQKIMTVLKDHGLTGSAEAQKQKMPQVFRTVTANIKKQLAQSKGAVGTADVTRSIDDALTNNPITSYIEDGTPMAKVRDKYINQLVSLANNGDNGLSLNAKQLFEFKQTLGKQLGRTFTKLEKNGTLDEREEVALSIWGAIDDLITKADPSIKDMTRAQSYMYKAMPGISASAKAPTAIPVVGKIPGATRPVQAVQDLAGRTLQGAGGIVDKVPTAVGSATLRGAPLVAADMALGNGQPAIDPGAAATTDPAAATTTDPNAATFVSPDGQWQTKADGKTYSMDDQWVWDDTAQDWVENPNPSAGNAAQLAELETAMKNATDKKSFDFYKAKYEQLSKMSGGGTGKSLTAGQQKELSDIDTSIELMGSLPATIKKYESKMSPITGRINAVNEYDVDAQTFNANMKAISQMVGKAMEGGVLRKEDEEKYRKMLPTIQDTPQVAYNKVQQVVQMLAIQKHVKENTYGGATADFTTGIDINAATAE